MLPLIVVAAIAVPVLELYVLVRVADLVGWPLALVVFVALPFLGVRVVRHYGIAAVRSVQEALRQRRLPGKSLLEHMLSTVAGLLIVLPGFVTAAIGGILLIPPVRRITAIGLFAFFTRHFHAATKMATAAVVLGRRRGDGIVDVTAVTTAPATGGPPPPEDVWIDTGWDGSATGAAELPGDVAPAGGTVDSGTRARMEESFFDAPFDAPLDAPFDAPTEQPSPPEASPPPEQPAAASPAPAGEIIDLTPVGATSTPSGEGETPAPHEDESAWEAFSPDPDSEGIPEKRRRGRKKRS